MSDVASRAEHFTVICVRCEEPVLARRTWVGSEVACPHCGSVICIPQPALNGAPVRARGPSLAPRRVFNFACGRCGTLLEANTGMSGQTGVCPSCAASFDIPHIDPLTGMPGEVVVNESEKQLPTPMHAYAASGTSAPQIVKDARGQMVIECPRCNAYSPVDAGACAGCGAPFTIESTATVEQLAGDRQAGVALVLGVVSIPLFFLALPALFAVLLGVSAMIRGGVSWRPALGAGLGAASLAGLAALVIF